MAYQPDQTKTLLWYDYETFGLDPRFDRIVQFAAIRTDLAFNPIGEPMMWYCQPADDYLPSPHACLVTGITPQQAQQEGLPEAEFMARINNAMSVPGTCTVGYNNIRFDDEFTRYGLYRNFMDPYAWSYQGGNSRWDLMDVIRAAVTLRPEGIHWPRDEDNQLVLKLDRLAPANSIEHSDAHDALADVRATIALAKLLQQAQPRLYNYCFQMKHKSQVWGQLGSLLSKPLLHVSGMYGREQGNIALVAVCANHPTNKNSVFAVDLRQDLSEWLNEDINTLNKGIFKFKSLGRERISIKEIHTNKSPIIAPMTTLDEALGQQYGIDRSLSLDRLKWLQGHTEFVQRLVQAYTLKPPAGSTDVDGQLYSDFFSDHDKRTMQKVMKTDPQHWQPQSFAFQDERLEPMLIRMKGRSYTHLLNEEETMAWEAYRLERLVEQPPQGVRDFSQFSQELNQLAEERTDPSSQTVLQDLALYAESIYPV